MKGFQVGFSRACISPQEPVFMGSEELSNRILTDIFTTCVAVTGTNGETALLFTNDLSTGPEAVVTPIRQAVSEATGIPFNHILTCATHTHSVPKINATGRECIVRFNEFFKEQMISAAKAALADQKPAQMLLGYCQMHPNATFVRHYTHPESDDTLSYFGANFGKHIYDDTTAHEHIPDRSIQLIKFQRAGDKDVILGNFQTHPHMNNQYGDRQVCTADVAGICRDEIEAALDCHFAYFSGAGGNINPYSNIKAENITDRDFRKHGRLMASGVIDAPIDFQEVPAGPVRSLQELFCGNVNHAEEHLLPQALKYIDIYNTEGKKAEGLKAIKEINSIFHARAIRRMPDAPDTRSMELSVIGIGNVAFVIAPYEMFDVNGLAIKEGSPFPTTFIASIGNGHNSYIPSRAAYGFKSYEVNVAHFQPGTGEVLADRYIRMLKQLY